MKLFSILSLSGLIALSACTMGQEQVMSQQHPAQYTQASTATNDINAESFDRYTTANQFPKTHTNSVEGSWGNDDYQLHLYQSGIHIIAVIGDALVVNRDWKRGDVKLLYNVATEKGLYLMGDRTPVNAHFTAQPAGQLTVKVSSSSDVFSFGKLR